MLELPLPQLARLLHSGEVHPRDLVAEIDSTLSGLTPAEHGFAHVDLDFALAQVEQLDTIPRDKRRKLWGIPIPVKDLSPVVGMPVSYGSVSRREIPEATDPFPEVLLNQGALIPGKTQTPVADSVVQSQQTAQRFENEEQQRQYAQSQSRGMSMA